MHSKDPVMVPHLLPDQAQLEAFIADLPLQIHSYLEEDQLYIATLQVRSLSFNISLSLSYLLFCRMSLSSVCFIQSPYNALSCVRLQYES